MAGLYNPVKHGEVTIPDLMPEQERDALHLAQRKRAADFSEPGAAKTLTALHAADLRSAKRILVIAPPIALRMWTRTAAAFFWTPLVYLLDSAAGGVTIPQDVRVVVTTYSIAANPAVRLWIKLWHPDCVILDEAHALKTLKAKRTEAVYGKKAYARNDSLIWEVPLVFPLTGTPIVRHNDDMFPHLMALAPKLMREEGLDSEAKFLKAFCVTALRSHHPRMRPKETVVRSQNTEILEQIVYGSGFAVRRLVTDLQAMPPVTFTSIDVEYVRSKELTEATRAIKAPELYEGDASAAATVRRMLGVAKAREVADFALEQHAIHGSALVLFWHRAVSEAIQEELLHRGVQLNRIAIIDGSTSAAKKSQYEDMFNAGELDFLLGQIASMGVSLNLQKGGNVAIFAEPDWSPSTIEQAFRRLWRFGQERHVQVFMCYADHPADQAAQNVLTNKTINIDLLSPSSSAAARMGE